jgi:uncharacterized protein DUF3828
MPTRRTMLFIAGRALGMVRGPGVAPAAAADASATAFVTKIYDAYKGQNSKGILIGTEAVLRRYFVPSLAALISKDQTAAARRHEVPTLDGDPFIDAQDWDISAVNVEERDVSPDKAVATVGFKNIDRPTTIVLDLVKAKSGWRIADITWQRESGEKETLRGLFRH